ncbi:MAG: sulfatase-like hydrolase/transferase, partial [Pirellulaceae bacterium]
MTRILLLFFTISLGGVSGLKAQERPNIVWILSEDNSMHYLRLYGAPLGATPQIEALAKEGVTFDHAFSCSPVCSVARTTLMTGMLAPRIGFQYHRKIT